MARRVLYWALPLGLAALQATYAVGAMHHIRHEELGASVTNPFFLAHRTVYDGISSNVGWYGLLLLVYETVGFSLFTAKLVKVAVSLVGLLSLAALLRRWFDAWRAAALVALWGTGPTLLYFTTVQAEYGLDLLLCPAVLWLLLGSQGEGGRRDLARQAAGWGAAMFACLAYPVFVMSLPAVALLWWRQRPRSRRDVAAGLVGLLSVFAIPLLYLVDPGTWLHDPHTGSGVFRGAGALHLEGAVFARSLARVLGDLFVSGGSYYFELPHVDFGHPLARVALVLAALSAGWAAARVRAYRVPVGLALLTIALNLVLPSWDDRYPGLRRSTGALLGLYVLFGIAWHAAARPGVPRLLRAASWAALLLLLGQNLVRLAPNLHSVRSQRSAWAERQWFTREPTPEASLALWLRETAAGQPLMTRHPQTGQLFELNYSEIYPTLAGYRRWNGEPAVTLRAYDGRTGKLVELHVGLWKDRYFDR